MMAAAMEPGSFGISRLVNIGLWKRADWFGVALLSPRGAPVQTRRPAR